MSSPSILTNSGISLRLTTRAGFSRRYALVVDEAVEGFAARKATGAWVVLSLDGREIGSGGSFSEAIASLV